MNLKIKFYVISMILTKSPKSISVNQVVGKIFTYFNNSHTRFAFHLPLNHHKMGLFGEKWASNARLDGKIALITGCNTGIGKYNVFDFYKRGCRVIMGCRDLVKAEKAKREIEEELKDCRNLGSISIEELDLSSFKSVRKFCEEILKKEPKINILVNNAGIMACPKAITEDGFELQFATNYLGHYLLTLLLLPRIIHSAPSKIINVSSIAHKIGRINFDDLNWEKNYSPTLAYAQSKLANILFTKELSRRLEGKEVNVYALHPGVVKTEIGRHMNTYIFPGFQKFYKGFIGLFLKSVKEGAQTQIYCAIDEKAGKETGLYYSNCRVASPASKACDMDTAKKLWEVSWEMVKLENYDPFQE